MEEQKKWYNVEIPYYTCNAIKRAENFKFALYDIFKFETSSVYHGNLNFIHFEILATEKDVPKLNKMLDEIVFFDAIREVRKV